MGLPDILVIGGMALLGAGIGYGVWWFLQRRNPKTAEAPPEAPAPEPVMEERIPEASIDAPAPVEAPLEATDPSEPVESTAEGADAPAEEGEAAEDAEVEEIAVEPEEVPKPRPDVATSLVAEAQAAVLEKVERIETALRDLAGAQAALLENDSTEAVEPDPRLDQIVTALEAQAERLDALDTRLSGLENSVAEVTQTPPAEVDTESITAALKDTGEAIRREISDQILPHISLLGEDVRRLSQANPEAGLAEIGEKLDGVIAGLDANMRAVGGEHAAAAAEIADREVLEPQILGENATAGPQDGDEAGLETDTVPLDEPGHDVVKREEDGAESASADEDDATVASETDVEPQADRQAAADATVDPAAVEDKLEETAPPAKRKLAYIPAGQSSTVSDASLGQG